MSGPVDWPDTVLAEYNAEGALEPIVMIRRGEYKYIHSPIDGPQLFNLANDPDELINLAYAPEHASRLEGPPSGAASEPPGRTRLAKIHVRLTHRGRGPPLTAFQEEVRVRWDLDTLKRAVLASQRRRLFVQQVWAACKGARCAGPRALADSALPVSPRPP